MPRILVFLLLTPLALAAGCKACTPGLPTPHKTDTSNNNDTGDTGDTGDTADSVDTTPVDTTPAPPCDVPEVEPNSIGTPQTLPLDEWACGTFENNDTSGTWDTALPVADLEAFTFSVDQADWVRVDVRAATVGSSADVKMDFVDPDDGDYSVLAFTSSESTDPYLVFPSDKARNFLTILTESYYGYGDDFTWQLRATVTKPPVTWTSEEVEPNNEFVEAEPITDGTVLFGKMDEHSDFDRFSITIPDDGAEYTVSASIVATNLGSPADLFFVLYDPTNIAKKYAYYGQNSYDRDPQLLYTVPTPGVWTLLLREELGAGSEAYWYVLTFNLTRVAPADTGDTGDTAGTDTAPPVSLR